MNGEPAEGLKMTLGIERLSLLLSTWQFRRQMFYIRAAAEFTLLHLNSNPSVVFTVKDCRTLTSSFTSAEILVLVRDRNMDRYMLSTWIRFQSSCVDLLSYLLLTLPIGHQTIQKRCFTIERLHQLQLAFLGVLYGENAFK